MEQIEITDPWLIKHLNSLTPDGMEIFILGDGIRGALLHGTRMVNKMKLNHGFNSLNTYILGEAYIAAGLLTSMVKGRDRIALQIECGGPIGGLSVEATASGEVRGYLKNPEMEVAAPEGPGLDTSPIFGPGFISVIKTITGTKHPFTGQTILRHGSIAKDLAYYFTVSEQTPTYIGLSVKFDNSGRVIGAGGLFLQILPGSDKSVLEDLEKDLEELPSLGSYFSEGNTADSLLKNYIRSAPYEIFGFRDIVFSCGCSRERFGSFLASLPGKERADILATGPFPLKTTCHNCNTTYEWTRTEMESIFSN